MGPLLGGFITTFLSWRVGFALEAVIIAVVLIGIGLVKDVPYHGDRSIDLVGALLSIVGMGGVVTGILVWQEGGGYVGLIIGIGVLGLGLLVFWLRSRKRRGKPKRNAAPAPPPVVGPVLVAAQWDVGATLLTLTFDRAVNATGLQPDSVVVFDGSAVTEYRNNGDVGQPTPESAEILMAEFGEFTGSGQHMTAIAGNGIVSQSDGAAWAGVTNLFLPFP